MRTTLELRSLVFVGLLASVVCAGIAEPTLAADPPVSQVPRLEQQLQYEYEQSGLAVADRLHYEATGNSEGANDAAQRAATHRDRYRALRRELAALTATAASPAVARNPFATDDAFSEHSTSRPGERDVARLDSEQRTIHQQKARDAAWDMYRPHAERMPVADRSPQESNGASSASATPGLAALDDRPEWGMYGRAMSPVSSAAPETNDRAHLVARSQEETESREAPSKPFFVYRNPSSSEHP